MDMAAARSSQIEKNRTADLLNLIPSLSGTALDIGTRDGHFSKLLTQHFDHVVALDLEQPQFEHPKVQCVKGDVTDLEYEDEHFDFVFCAEVLEHIPSNLLPRACEELARVTKHNALIGVPYKQDLRVGKTTCRSCGKTNPPWGHVNSFDESILESLFSGLTVAKVSYVERSNEVSNGVSSCLMNLAGNPYGTYCQEESCVYCGGQLGVPQERQVWQKIATKLAITIEVFQRQFTKPHPQWIHLLLQKST